MAILFAVVARGTTILAKHAWCGGNFLEVTEQILAKIPSENNKLTYSHSSYLFHYICHDRIIYLCITDDDFERSRAFSFLSEVKKRFQTTYGSRAQTALPYAMNSEFSSTLAAQMKHHSDPRGSDRVTETQMQVDDLKGIMVRDIDLVAQRGEKLELLIDKTENLVDSSVTFKTTSRNLARAMCMKNLKLTVVVVLVSLVVLYIIVSAACGGLSWQSCVRKTRSPNFMPTFISSHHVAYIRCGRINLVLLSVWYIHPVSSTRWPDVSEETYSTCKHQ
ncbi:Vesicle-associated membrane protein [Ataeniobius toweri]|uniref:Vesicle-associated membrane protein 7 n=1 Tax=Ataeniobius toweri TaxID=208326 RepID=A0ABU7AB84_9TELE|nr:Vesicle-associated membrane protein [Ataeniobius toweri]